MLNCLCSWLCTSQGLIKRKGKAIKTCAWLGLEQLIIFLPVWFFLRQGRKTSVCGSDCTEIAHPRESTSSKSAWDFLYILGEAETNPPGTLGEGQMATLIRSCWSFLRPAVFWLPLSWSYLAAPDTFTFLRGPPDILQWSWPWSSMEKHTK